MQSKVVEYLKPRL